MGMEILRVKWLDSGRHAFEWTESIDLDVSIPTIETVGFLYKETDSALTMVQSVGVDLLAGKPDELLFAITIPKVCITERDTLCPTSQNKQDKKENI